mgnify:FL=1
MNLAAFKRSLADTAPPDGVGAALAGLWWDAKGDWDRAHDCAQAQDDKAGAWVHAYLHRKEGDPDNASYWYRRAGRKPSATPLVEEWEVIVRGLLAAE